MKELIHEVLAHHGYETSSYFLGHWTRRWSSRMKSETRRRLALRIKSDLEGIGLQLVRGPVDKSALYRRAGETGTLRLIFKSSSYGSYRTHSTAWFEDK